MIIIGAFITAYGLEAVLIPNNVSDGGVTGLSIVSSRLFGLPLGALIAVINIPFVWLGYKQIGKSDLFYYRNCFISSRYRCHARNTSYY